MRKRIAARLSRAGLALAMAMLLATPTAALGDAPGTPIYGPFKADEGGEYPRAIRLRHSGDANGTLLATFEHSFRDGTPGYLVIKRSTDDGASWSTAATIPEPNRWPTMWQPFFLELPKRIGRYPAGTILLAENSSRKPDTRIFLFSSPDHGSTWHPDSVVTSGGGPRQGVWEPFLLIDAMGRLVIYFSDERRRDQYAQFLGGYVFDERSNTFDTNNEINLASGGETDRPGMVTIAAVPSRGFIAAYEVCTTLRVGHCPVHVKTSTDGLHWPVGLGDTVGARDGNAPSNNPYLVWSPVGGPGGRLSLIAMHTAEPASNLILINQDPSFRPDAWEWTPRPYANLHPQYSASLLPSPDGRQMRLFGAARLDDAVRPYVLTASANAGVLPYADSFATGVDRGWLDFGGIWTVSKEDGEGVYSNAGGPGAKAIAGSSLWRDYSLRSDIRLDHAGQAGVLVRVSHPAIGADALDGYFIGINPRSGVLFAGREDGGWTRLASVPVPGLVTGHWYTIAVRASGPRFEAMVVEKGTAAPMGRIAFEDGRFATGAIGLRDFNTSASWKNVRVDNAMRYPPRQERPMMQSGSP